MRLSPTKMVLFYGDFSGISQINAAFNSGGSVMEDLGGISGIYVAMFMILPSGTQTWQW